MKRLLLGFCLMLSIPVWASHYHQHHFDPLFYLGFNAGPFSRGVMDSSLFGGSVRGGLMLSPYFGAEMLLGGSIWETKDGSNREERISNLSGLYLRANIPGRRSQVYGLIGISGFDVQQRQTFAINGLQVSEISSERFEGGSVGAGWEVFLTPFSSINFQWMRYMEEVYPLSHWSIGLQLNY